MLSLDQTDYPLSTTGFKDHAVPAGITAIITGNATIRCRMTCKCRLFDILDSLNYIHV
jgi:hypothetical protein